jgi:predicted small integral membrane protein
MRHALQYALILLLAVSCRAQTAPDATIGGALRSLAARAAVVFVGQVVKVEPKAGVVEVTFRVDRVVQGAVGSTYIVREWAGLWANGQPRYVPGQRAMVFLHAPGAAGLGTPVDGMEGVVPVAATSADAAPALDVRWLATRVQRSVGAPLVAARVSVDDAVAAVRGSSEPRLLASPVTLKPAPPVPVRLLPGGVLQPGGGGADGSVGRGPQILVRPVVRDVR